MNAEEQIFGRISHDEGECEPKGLANRVLGTLALVSVLSFYSTNMAYTGNAPINERQESVIEKKIQQEYADSDYHGAVSPRKQ